MANNAKNRDKYSWELSSSEDIDKYKNVLYSMYKSRPIDTPIQDANSLVTYYPCNILLLLNNEEVKGAIMWWQTDYGNKLSTSFSNSPDVYKKYIIPKYAELLSTNGFYAELSDALEYLLSKTEPKIKNIQDSNVIKDVIGVKDEDIFTEDDARRTEFPLNIKDGHPIPSYPGSYLRDIKGIGLHRKALYGRPCLTKQFDGIGCDKKCVLTGGAKTKSHKRKSKHKHRKLTNKK